MILQDWINDKLKEVAAKLPTLVHTEAASFSCGYNTGYKHALLDLESIIEEGAKITESKCWCKNKYHGPEEVCL